MCHTYHACQHGLRAHVRKCEKRANFPLLLDNVPINAPTCRRCANYSTWRANVPKVYQSFNFVCQKAYQFFNYFSKNFFNFWIFQLCSPFANFKNIWAIVESREAKSLSFDICKISLRKNLVNLKPLTSFSVEHGHISYILEANSKRLTLLCLIVVGGYIAFFQIFHPQNHFIMTLPFYQNVKLGLTPTFYYQTPHIRLFWFHRKQKTFKTRQNSF